jgi:hypothetical protein
MQMLLKSRKNFSGQDFTSGSKVTVQNVTIWQRWKNGDRIGSCWVATELYI